jgi:hypothetical protein
LTERQTENTLHRLSPYIGKLKSDIASRLVAEYSRPGDLVVDPFAGSGTIPLEACAQGRSAFASDNSPYAAVLTQAKLFPPANVSAALRGANKLLTLAKMRSPDLRRVPRWVRQFFHPETLREAVAFADVCRETSQYFYLACLLGILHHQRPGFLSFPASHLVPYLRNRSFPRDLFPDLYAYRALQPRLIAKIERTYKNATMTRREITRKFVLADARHVALPKGFDCLITSPPYMNALDYNRDNRLRLWFCDPQRTRPVEDPATRRRREFEATMRQLVASAEEHARPGAACIFVVGEEVRRSQESHPAEIVDSIVRHVAPKLRLRGRLHDAIPDIRRARRSYKTTKVEVVLIYKKVVR